MLMIYIFDICAYIAKVGFINIEFFFLVTEKSDLCKDYFTFGLFYIWKPFQKEENPLFSVKCQR